MDAQDNSDSDKENQDPAQNNIPAYLRKPPPGYNSKPHPGIIGEKPKSSKYCPQLPLLIPQAPDITEEVLDAMDRDKAKFLVEHDQRVREICGSRAAKSYRYHFYPGTRKETDFNSSIVPMPKKGMKHWWWKTTSPGYPEDEVWYPGWKPRIYGDYMDMRKQVAVQFIYISKRQAENGIRRRNVLLEMHRLNAIRVSNGGENDENIPKVPAIWDPIFRVCSVTNNWYPLEGYDATRDPFLHGFDIFYPDTIVNVLFKFDPPPFYGRHFIHKGEILRLARHMQDFTRYNEPENLDKVTIPDQPGIIYTPYPFICMGERGPWEMIPKDVEDPEIRRKRAKQRAKELRDTKPLEVNTFDYNRLAQKASNLRI